jgi:hypothetical protein
MSMRHFHSRFAALISMCLIVGCKPHVPPGPQEPTVPSNPANPKATTESQVSNDAERPELVQPVADRSAGPERIPISAIFILPAAEGLTGTLPDIRTPKLP